MSKIPTFLSTSLHPCKINNLVLKKRDNLRICHREVGDFMKLFSSGFRLIDSWIMHVSSVVVVD